MEQINILFHSSTANISLVAERETVLTERGKNALNVVPFSPFNNIFLRCHLNVVSVEGEWIQMCVI